MKLKKDILKEKIKEQLGDENLSLALTREQKRKIIYNKAGKHARAKTRKYKK